MTLEQRNQHRHTHTAVRNSNRVQWISMGVNTTRIPSTEKYFIPEEGSSMFLRKASLYMEVHTALRPYRQTATIIYLRFI
jgi:hypothetical protein